MHYAEGMPLELDSKVIDRYGSVPMYRQLADRLREAIAGHEIEPGESLPAEGAIAKVTGLSRTAVREAMDVLTNEGLVIRRSGVPTRVAKAPPVRRLDASRYLKELQLLRAGDRPQTSAFADDHGVKLSEVDVDADYTKGPATKADADHLAVKTRVPVLRRQLLKYVHGRPVQIQRSTIPYSIAKGTLLEDPSEQPFPGGTIAELWAVGIAVTRVSEDIWSRMPSSDERQRLQIEAVGPVWDIVRTFWGVTGMTGSKTVSVGDERVVEASRVIAPANRNILHYETVLTAAD